MPHNSQKLDSSSPIDCTVQQSVISQLLEGSNLSNAYLKDFLENI